MKTLLSPLSGNALAVVVRISWSCAFAFGRVDPVVYAALAALILNGMRL